MPLTNNTDKQVTNLSSEQQTDCPKVGA